MDRVAHMTWVSYHDDILSRGYWDQGIIEDILKQANYVDHTGFKWLDAYRPGEIGSIVVINGRTHFEPEDIKKLNDDLSLLKWVVLIVTGDEESLFPPTEIHHPLLKMWVQLPRINKHNDVYRLPNGPRPDTHEKLKTLDSDDRVYDWSFVGQITHDRRFECRLAFQNLENGFAHSTTGFGGLDGPDKNSIPENDYLGIMRHSKMVLCPSGPESPDSFRVWEALEAGCLPIVDSHSTNNPEPGFWEYLLGNDLPFPIVNEWNELPDLLPQLLADYPHNVNRAFAWWQLKKREIRIELEATVKQWI